MGIHGIYMGVQQMGAQRICKLDVLQEELIREPLLVGQKPIEQCLKLGHGNALGQVQLWSCETRAMLQCFT